MEGLELGQLLVTTDRQKGTSPRGGLEGVRIASGVPKASRCWAHLEHIAEEHRVLLERTPAVQDVQSAWLILLHCAAARAN